MTGNLRLLVCMLAPVLLVLSCRGEPRARTPLAPTPVVRPSEPVLSLVELDDLLAAADQPALALPADADPVARYRLAIRDRLGRDGFWRMFAPKLLSILDVHTKNKPGHTIRDLLVERQLPYGRRYHYNKRLGDCGGVDLVEVRPWWNTAAPIMVCRDSVRADVTRQSNGAYCEAVMQVADDGCGCGPHLLLCAPSESYRKEMAAQTADEVALTLKHIADTGARYSTLLTTDSTVRSSFGDYWYARSAFFQGEPLELPRMDARSRADFSLRPRRPEHHGTGILTTPYVLYSDVARRVIVQNLWNDLLCVDWKAVGVDPHTLIEVTADTPDLRGAVLPRLAETPGCKGCHTRLEYPSMALQSFLNAYQGGRYVAPREPTTFRFHVRGDEDYRGEAPADPRSLANLIIEQPEFTSCAVKHVTEFVYQGHPVPAAVRDRLLASFRADENLGKLIEDTLIARIFGDGALAPATASDHRAPAGRALFEATCEPCHRKRSEQRPVLSAASLPPPLANRALREVLALTMPPAGAAEISPSERAAIAGWLCAETRRSAGDCAQVMSRRGRVAPTGDLYFARTSRITTGKLADQDVFVDGVRVHSRMSARIQMLDPTFVLLTAGVALAACADASDDAAKQACVDAYLAAALDPVPAPPPAGEGR